MGRSDSREPHFRGEVDDHHDAGHFDHREHPDDDGESYHDGSHITRNRRYCGAELAPADGVWQQFTAGEPLCVGPERSGDGARGRRFHGEDELGRVCGPELRCEPEDHVLVCPRYSYPGYRRLQPDQPADGDTFIGAPGAVISGQDDNESAFDGTATGVTIEYLTVEGFVPPGSQGTVNHDSGADWTVKYDTIEDNGNTAGSGDGGALMMGDGDVYEYNCLTNNGEYALNAYDENEANGGPQGTTFAYNEVSYNGVADFPDVSSCGCSGGIKYWASTGAVVADNYIHDNYNVGLWFDTDNVGALVDGNYIAANWAEGAVYEISYNADITANTFLDNGWGVGSYSGPADFPLGDGLYINGSAGDAALDGGLYSPLAVTANVFTDNWDGIVIYQNPDRICGTPGNSSTGSCTLVDPSVYNTTSCGDWAAGASPTGPSGDPDYYDGCQWKANNIDVSGNTFNFNPSDIINGSSAVDLPDITYSDCYSGPNFRDTSAAPPTGNDYWCGFNGMFAAGGSLAPFTGNVGAYVVAAAIMGKTGSSGEAPDTNTWAHNTYAGPWAFQAYYQGTSPVTSDIYPAGVQTTLDFKSWQSVWGMDVGSTESGS